ncbi:hypothetical protein OHT57_26320 [Streptomyces sp. NBC_00285]|uniref:hypothetical protein n=1 Tax=Streptomyces sp. NBC_00285 TaxID=2975700 RepID=UPI002E2AC3E7|nr:hypothetical protein [Streptomyces sp. NBC_00285]
MLAAALLAALFAAILPGSAVADGGDGSTPDHWGVIARNTIGSPVAELRNGPYVSGVPASVAKPPFGRGSLGIEVANNSTTLTPPSEKVDFGNEVDFVGNRILTLRQVGFRVFQTGENVVYGGATNMPNIRFEIDPNVPSAPNDNYSTLVWVPPGISAVNANRWSPYLDATTTGTWYLTGGETACTSSSPCTFTQLRTSFTSVSATPTVFSVAVGKGRDNMWVGAIDGLRLNGRIYDFERDGVRRLRAS